jgi:two-component system cell cycle sensor histidine kinase/response regulator CckA
MMSFTDQRQPAVSPEAGSSPTSVQANASQRTILIVEDEPGVRLLLQLVLQQTGHRLLEAHSGLQAIRMSQQHDGAIHLVVSDVMLPDLNGPKLIEKLREHRPDLRVLFISGYSRSILGNFPLEEGRAAFLNKPFQPTELLTLIGQLTA